MHQLDIDKFKHEVPGPIKVAAKESGSQLTAQRMSDRSIKTLSGKALLVDDEPAVLHYTCAMLERIGFQVVDASSSRLALQAFESEGPFDLAMADMGLAKISGPRLLNLLRSQQPDLRTLLISGLPDPFAEGPGAPSEAIPFLAKPFGFDELEDKLRDMFNPPQDDGPAS